MTLSSTLSMCDHSDQRAPEGHLTNLSRSPYGCGLQVLDWAQQMKDKVPSRDYYDGMAHPSSVDNLPYFCTVVLLIARLERQLAHPERDQRLRGNASCEEEVRERCRLLRAPRWCICFSMI